MLESVLVADRGLGAARVLLTCRRLGIKSVLAGLSDDADAIPTDASHLADDLVLLSNVDELSDPTAVVRAAVAAGVQAIHPGYGPLRGDAQLARATLNASLIAIATAGVGTAEENERALARSVPAVPTAAAGSPVTRWIYVLGAPTGSVVLGSVRVADGLLVAAAPTAAESVAVAADHRLAQATSAVLGLAGLAAVGVGADGVAAVVAGLPETHAPWELVADVDLVELQLLAATGESTLTAQSDFPLAGVAVGRSAPEIVDDIRALDHAARAGLRVDAVALANSAHGALVRVSAWGADLASAQQVLSASA